MADFDGSLPDFIVRIICREDKITKKYMISSRAGKSECLYALSLPENLGEVDIIT